jgi:hypothetical protein
MGLLSSIFGSSTPVQATISKAGASVKSDAFDMRSETLMNKRLSPFEENPAKARRRRPRGLSFGERSWSRE